MSCKHNAVIFAACDIEKIKYDRHENDYVIAADKGFIHALDLGVVCDRVIGDFDSLGAVPKHDALTLLPVEKDDTDTAFAVKCALDMGVERIFILGGLGGRLDHTLANIQLLTYIARAGAIGYLISGDEAMTVVRNAKAVIHGKRGQTVSVFSLSDRSVGVCESGLKYSLDDAFLDSGFPLGVSNEFADTCAEVSVNDGELLIYSRGDMCDFIEKNRLTQGDAQQALSIYF